MILWFIVGFIVWTLCISLMLAVLHGGHRIRGHGYEQKLYSKNTVKDSIKKEVKKTTRTRTRTRARRKQCLPIS